jgi:hypothetical protein
MAEGYCDFPQSFQAVPEEYVEIRQLFPHLPSVCQHSLYS